MNNLKSCPFCGGVAKLNAPGYEYYSPCWCKCTQCGAEGPTKSSELEAEKGWNERVQDDVERAQTVGGWISVKERMPENDNPVLARESQGFTYVDNYKKEEKWRKWQIGDCYGGTITHWMPLPEPPKEEAEDDD